MEQNQPEVPPPPRARNEGTESLVAALAAVSKQYKLAEIGKSLSALGVVGKHSEISKAMESIRGSTASLAALGLRTQQIQSDLSRIQLPAYVPYEPPDTTEINKAIDRAMAAKRQRDAERDAAVIATSRATAEVAQAVQALATVNAQTLAEIATMRRDSRWLVYLTAISVVALVAVTFLR